MQEKTRSGIRWKWLGIILIAVLMVGAGAAVYRSRKAAPAGASAPEKKLLYHCPMHPFYISEHPGECPICGMSLVPVREETTEAAGMEGRKSKKEEYPSAVPGHATVTFTPEKIQLIGVRTGKVEWLNSDKEIRTVGLVRAAETFIYNVNTKVEGWVERLFADFEGKSVRKGQPLLTLYSPDLVSTQEEYLLALRAQKRLSQSPFPEVAQGGDSLLEATRRRLLLWDIPPAEIKKIEESGRPLKTLTLYAPAGGVVTKKQVFPGMKVMPGMSLYELADLSRIWVEADVYEYEIHDVKVGDRAALTVNALPDKEWQGRVVFINPYLDNQTRTVKVRFEFSNPSLTLKPGMYANVLLKIPLGRQLAVPFEAVMNLGDHAIVFVDRGEGRFQPVEVKLGDKANENYYVVKAGLQPGESVVTSGNFLVDSESRLKAPSQAAETMPGMEGMPMPAAPESQGPTAMPPGHKHGE